MLLPIRNLNSSCEKDDNIATIVPGHLEGPLRIRERPASSWSFPPKPQWELQDKENGSFALTTLVAMRRLAPEAGMLSFTGS
jgi:hypothetical protein